MVAIPNPLEQVEGDPIWTKKLAEMTVEERREWFSRMTEIAAKNRASEPVLSEEEIDALIRNRRFGVGD